MVSVYLTVTVSISFMLDQYVYPILVDVGIHFLIEPYVYLYYVHDLQMDMIW